jgi:hypothetical protein
MKKHGFRLFSILAIGIILLGVLGFQALGAETVMADSKSVVGSWNVTITVINQNAEFPGLVTFFNDGALLTDETPVLYETSGHGAWVKTKPNEAAYTFSFLYGSESGAWMKGTVSGKAVYDSKLDQWSGPFTIQIVDQGGNEILSDTGTMQGTRIFPGS